MDLSFVEDDVLLEELKKRFEVVVFAGKPKENKEFLEYFWWDGDNPTMIYLCEKMKKNIFKEQHEEDEEFC